MLGPNITISIDLETFITFYPEVVGVSLPVMCFESVSARKPLPTDIAFMWFLSLVDQLVNAPHRVLSERLSTPTI